MKKHTFKGGIHPYDGKEMSKSKPIKTLPAGDVMVYPLVQHIGAPAVAAVKPGDKVLMGQVIGNAGGFVSSNIISSVSGTVKAVEPRLTVSGSKVMSIVIENDHEDRAIDGLYEDVDYTTLTKEQIRARVKDAGIVGMGGAGFPNHVKISPKDDSAIEYVIVNGAECEPYLTCDDQLMRLKADEIVEGLEVGDDLDASVYSRLSDGPCRDVAEKFFRVRISSAGRRQISGRDLQYHVAVSYL